MKQQLIARIDEDPRLNNLRVNNNRLKDTQQLRPTSNPKASTSTYTRPPKASKYQRGSLDNVSNINVERNQLLEPLSLRRCRSLALTEEDVFSSLEIRYDDRPSRRPQLIPRARLVERNPREQRYGSRVTSTEDLYNRPSRTVTDRKYNLETSLNAGKPRRTKENASASLDNAQYPEENEYDSLEFLPEYQKVGEPPGLNLPNYYPDSRYESDNTDNVSTVDNISVSTVGYKKYQSCDNLSTQNFQDQPESISYDENIVLSKNRPLYGALQDATCEKPRTIRSPTALTSEEYFSATTCKPEENEKTFKQDYKAVEELETEEKNKIVTSLPVEEESKKERDVSYDEVNSLKDSSIGIYSTVEINPLYETNNLTVEVNAEPEERQSAEETCHPVNCENDLATNINIEYGSKENGEDFKTIVRVDSNAASISSTDEETKVENKEKQHSHNYLREFLETQKGSKKPLQNFLIKKFPNLSRKNSKEKHTNLVDNNFYSLPDITVCKNLKKCDKIDRKLRNCGKVAKSGESEARFIVNIGSHFDLTANNNIPVDFELKLAKVPKKKKNQIKSQKAEEFLQAVKDLNQTLEDNNHNKIDTKPEIIAIKTKNLENRDDSYKPSDNEVTMELSQSEMEYQDKLGNMRTYWNKLVGHNSNSKESKNNEDSKCKIVDVQTKVEDVKKKFESEEDKQEKPINKVQIAKQIFENRPTERIEKVSPLIKNTCSFFENTAHDINNQYESLNPNIVEIIEKKNAEEKTDGVDNSVKQTQTTKTEKKKPHKPVTKSLSITYPEFDYVRYRVVKSDLFQKRIFAKCDMESQFDGLMQYLQDYSFQELLIDNNIVIIEPIRTTIIRENASKYHKPAKNVTPLLHKNNESGNQRNGLRKHFFYHPVRVNKEVNDNELPNPDTVKQVRQLFEKKEKCITNINRKKFENSRKNIDLDKDICSVDSTRSIRSENGNHEYTSLDSFDEEPCCEQQYITEDVMEKIRKYGTTITYYGGRIVRKQCSQDSLTNVIMEEIKKNETKDSRCKYDTVGEKEKKYQGLKFKLVKSNSCSSRLELVGTQNLATSRQKYFKKRQELIKEAEEKPVDGQNQKLLDKNEINECIKKQTSAQQSKPKTDNKSYTKWGDKTQEQTIYGIQFNDKIIEKVPLKTKYEFHNYEQNENKTRIIEDMDFEPYEIA